MQSSAVSLQRQRGAYSKQLPPRVHLAPLRMAAKHTTLNGKDSFALFFFFSRDKMTYPVLEGKPPTKLFPALSNNRNILL